MSKLTYKQAYDLIIDAYFKDEIEPFNVKFCFCGTLAGGESWSYGNHWLWSFNRKEHNYSKSEYGRMEAALLIAMNATRCGGGRGAWCVGVTAVRPHDEKYEDKLFAGMCAALDVLREIHIGRGEIVDAPVFTKRNLQTQKI